MHDDLRAGAVRKLLALAERIKAGEDVGEVFYCYDPEDGFTHGMHADGAQAMAERSLSYSRDDAGDGWHPDMAQLEWGIMVPIEVCRLTETQPTPGGEFDERWDYALVDPDTYTGPTELPADPSDEDCDDGTCAPPGGE